MRPAANPPPLARVQLPPTPLSYNQHYHQQYQQQQYPHPPQFHPNRFAGQPPSTMDPYEELLNRPFGLPERYANYHPRSAPAQSQSAYGLLLGALANSAPYRTPGISQEYRGPHGTAGYGQMPQPQSAERRDYEQQGGGSQQQAYYDGYQQQQNYQRTQPSQPMQPQHSTGAEQMTPQEQGPPDPIASLLESRRRREDAVSFFNPAATQANPMAFRGLRPGEFILPSSVGGRPPTNAGTGTPLSGYGAPPSNKIAALTRLAHINADGELYSDVRHGNRLKKLLGAPQDKELWLETRTGSSIGGIAQIDNPLEEDRPYYYNPTTLRVTFDKPSPLHSHMVPQSECQKLLDMITPTTLLVKRVYKTLTEEKVRAYFEKFGPIAFVKVCRYKDLARVVTKSGGSRNLIYFRMETVQAQSKIVEQTFHTIEEGQQVEVRIPANRIFIARVPDGTYPGQLVRFFSHEVTQIDPKGYCVDAYFPLPYRQFAFCTVGGQQLAAKLALKADFFFNDVSLSVAPCITEWQIDAERLLERKIRDLVDKNELSRVRSLQSISVEVKFLLQVLSKMKKFVTQRNLLAEINIQFLKCTEEKLRHYLSVQEHVLDICKVVALKSEDPENEDFNISRKRQRVSSTFGDGEEGGEDEEEAGEEENFDEDETAAQLTSQPGDQFFISSASADAANPNPEESTTHIMKILTK